MTLRATLDDNAADVAALPAYLRGRSLSMFPRRILVLATNKLRDRIAEIEAEIIRRPEK